MNVDDVTLAAMIARAEYYVANPLVEPKEPLAPANVVRLDDFRERRKTGPVA